MSDIFHITGRRARKTHRCGEMGCRADILPGQMYTYYHGVSDGSGFSFKACMWCAYVRWFMTGWYLDNGMLNRDDIVIINPETASSWKQPFKRFALTGRRGYVQRLWSEPGFNQGKVLVYFPKLRGKGTPDWANIDPRDLIVVGRLKREGTPHA